MHRILFVDDDPAICQLFRKLFHRGDCIVDVATDARAALALVEEHDYSLVVSDFQMPVVNGAELLARVCDRRPGTIRILVTASRDFDALVEVVNRGEVFRMIPKPWRIEELSFAIRMALDTRALQDQGSRNDADRRLRKQLR